MNDLKDNLVLMCNNLYLSEDSSILKDFSQEQMTKSETYTNVEKDLQFTPLFEKAVLFDMCEKGSLLGLVNWLNNVYGVSSGNNTITFSIGKPIIEVEKVTQTDVDDSINEDKEEGL